MSQFPRSRFAPRRRNLSRSIFSTRFRSFLALSLAALIFQTPFAFAASARIMNAQQSASLKSASLKAADSSSALTASNQGAAETDYTDYFVVKMADGEATCLDATFAEAPIRMSKADGTGETFPDSGQKPVNRGYDDYAHAQSTSGVDGVDEVGSGGLTINFNELSQLQSDPDRANVVAAFTKAAQVWTDRIKSPVTITVNIDYGSLVPNCTDDPKTPDVNECEFKTNVIGATGSSAILVDYPGLRTNLRASSSSAAETAIYNALPGASVVPSDTGNGAAIRVNRALAKGLGLSTSTTAVATIGFNKGFSFDFNPDDGIDPGKTDFVAVAAHEMGHALGFVSGGSDSNTSFMAVWDIFRFRPGANFANFSTAERVMSIGGPNPAQELNQVYFTGQNFTYGSFNTPATELGLSTGGPDPGPTTGDGHQSSHWKDDRGFTSAYIGIMDPTIGSGVHKAATENDFSALETIGWNLVNVTAPPPAPPAATPPPNNNFANAEVLSGCSGSVNGVNVGATKEAGEPNNPESPTSTRSVWYQWTAPVSGNVTIDTVGSRFDTIMAVYTGNSLGALTLVGSHDDIDPGVNTVSSLTFNATQGTVYRIEVDGYNNSNGGGDFGPIKLNWAQVNCVQQPPTPTVQLSQSAYGIAEGGGSLAVAVTRSDSTSAANVDYATSDPAGLTPCDTFNGIASSRCDYATTIGTLRFAAGESTKNIFIPLVDDAWAEGTETFTLTLSNPAGAVLGSTTSATITLSDNDANSTASNPIDQNAFFVRQQYVDFLGREPDSVGLAGWLNVLNNCPPSGKDANGNFCDKIEVSAGFFRSKEFQERGYFIYKFYSAVGRIPLYPEFMPDLAKVSGFLSDAQLESNKDAFVTEFMARQEYQNKYGAITDPTAYVNALLNTVGLPNHPSKGGWIGGLTSGSLTRAKVLRELTESSEMQAKYNTEAFVIMQYFGYLRRSADASYLAWIDIMNQNPTNYHGMIDGFINSNEYRKRFGQ